MIKEDFLESYFQQKIDEAYVLAATPGEEERPYDNFYKARDLLTEVLNDEVMQDESDVDVLALKGYLHYEIGRLNFETEENYNAKQSYLKCLETFAKLPVRRMAGFFNQLQNIYNSLGLMYLNGEDTAKGMGYLLKAEKLYEKVVEIIRETKESCYCNMEMFTIKLREFAADPQERALHHKKYAILNMYKEVRPVFRFYYEGGLEIESTEKLYTLTCFYLAQAHSKTKESGKDRSAYYCGVTLKRQVDCGDYEAKDWANNSMGLAEYYKQERMYSQALYIVFTALDLLPADRHRKTKASLRIMLGNIMNDFFEYNVTLIRADLHEKGDKEVEQLEKFINKQALVFEGVSINFPTNKVYRNYEEIKTLFKMIMTEYKKALEVYVLDGNVTEHVQIIKEMSSVYKKLSLLETDADRKVAMELKRKELIEPLFKELNPKAYIGLWRVPIYNSRNYALNWLRFAIMRSRSVGWRSSRTATRWTSRTRR